MVREIAEADWKLFRRLHSIALERFCQQVIEEIKSATSDCIGGFHKRYLEILNLIIDRNEQMARAFDDMRRSTALIMLANIKEHQLLTEQEFAQFSANTVRGLKRYWKFVAAK